MHHIQAGEVRSAITDLISDGAEPDDIIEAITEYASGPQRKFLERSLKAHETPTHKKAEPAERPIPRRIELMFWAGMVVAVLLIVFMIAGREGG